MPDDIPQEALSKPKGIHNARWEKSFIRIITPFQEFVNRQTSSGLLLIITTTFALILANSPFADSYQALLNFPLKLSIGSWRVENSMQHWVNEGLMTFFFFVVGLELKREFLVGELSGLRKTILPIIAAVGGMVVPALLYFILNTSDETMRGWGIPMATDIAFALGVLILLGNRIPKTLFSFLVALAIVDDLGSIIVIALFYTESLVLSKLVLSGILVLSSFFLNFSGIRKPLPYFIVGILLWFTLLQSGVNATLAGVLIAFTIPSQPKYNPEHFSTQMKDLMRRFDTHYCINENVMTNNRLRGIIQALQNNIYRVETPLQYFEHSLHLPVAFFVLPAFAFFNAGISIDPNTTLNMLNHSVTQGVILGLILGKFLGITGSTWLALQCGITTLPANIRLSQIAGIALLSGIGFTMAIFIAELSFIQQPEYLLMVKTGILIASLLAGIIGFIWLSFTTKLPKEPN